MWEYKIINQNKKNMSKDFNLPPVDVIEKKSIEVKIYHFYPLILKKFKEFKREHLGDIKGFVHRLREKTPSVKLEDYIAIQIARYAIGEYELYIWSDSYRVNRFHLMAIFKKALRDSGISQML